MSLFIFTISWFSDQSKEGLVGFESEFFATGVQLTLRFKETLISKNAESPEMSRASSLGFSLFRFKVRRQHF